MFRLYPVCLLLAATLGHAAESLPEKYAALGRLVVGPMAAAPFPHPARAQGHDYDGAHYAAAEHYADSTVAVFIPKGFRETGRVDVVVHLHGWRNTVAGTLSTFRLAEQLVASGRNAVLVVPEGPHDAPDSFGGKLEDAGGFARLMVEVAATLRREGGFARTDFTLGRIIVSAHSGGGEALAAILDRGGMEGEVAEAWLFDALYNGEGLCAAWAARAHGRLVDLYTDHGGTKGPTERLMARLRAEGRPFRQAEERTLAPADLRGGGLIFIHTELGHNDVLAVREQFRLLLETSVLEGR